LRQKLGEAGRELATRFQEQLAISFEKELFLKQDMVLSSD
jgi:hypothetical protein